MQSSSRAAAKDDMEEDRRRAAKMSSEESSGAAEDDDSGTNPASSDNDDGDEDQDDEVGAVVVRRRGKSLRKAAKKEKKTPGPSRRISSRTTKFTNSMKEPPTGSEEAQAEKVPTSRSRYRRIQTSEDDDDSDSEGSPARIRRASSRATRFTKSMKEPPSDSVQDLFPTGESQKVESRTVSRKSSAEEEGDESDSDDSEVKPPRRQRKTKTHQRTGSPRGRKSTSIRHTNSEDSDDLAYNESGDESDEQGEDERNELKIQRILASRSETRKKWREICSTMNTAEVDDGSRWKQDEGETECRDDDDVIEERFLVKWNGLSFMHVSWETHADLVAETEGAKTYLTTFFRKSVNGLLFTQDERCDGDYFDPAYAQIERILQVCIDKEIAADEVKMPETAEEEDKCSASDFGIVTDKNHPEFERGRGRVLYIKWRNLPYVDCTYEYERDLIINDIDYKDQLKDFLERNRKPSTTAIKQLDKAMETERRRAYKIFGDSSNKEDTQRQQDVEEYQRRLQEHVFPNGGQLRDYQSEGVSWLLSNWVNDRSSILADEMGLGKTLQSAAFVDLVVNKMHHTRPFLVVVPLSTISHWQREFLNWTSLNAIVYHGSANDRDAIRKYEFAYECDRPGQVGANQLYLKKCCGKDSNFLWMVQVVITTPEMLVADDWAELTAVHWDALIVDEAHRMKNIKSQLALNLRQGSFKFNHKILLTGTPIQNDLREFFSLLNFVDPDEYDDLDQFLEEYGDMQTKAEIDDLHEKIRPYILRRLKEDVEKSVPPKEETLIEVELTILQKQYYRALYEKNVAFLHRNKKKALDGPGLNNLAMQLRKCCNHLFLLNGVEEDARKDQMKDGSLSEVDFLVRGSGKLVLLDKLLPRLKENGHRILLFSQFKIMLDILEDYLQLREMKFERIDGSITGWKRQQAIDRFQNGEGKDPPFVMLLSTRAGGVGINLTAADTVIIFDSDWNPQNDLQAQARCHRIGQTKDVKVYRLLSRKSYEMQMFHMSSLKMGLDQAVLKGFETGSGEASMTKDEVERLLRHGAYEIFNEEKAGAAEQESNAFVQQDIDSILERRSRTVIHKNTGSQSNAAGSTFSKASFKAPRTPGGPEHQASDDIDVEDPEFWTKMVGAAPSEEVTDLGRRKRNQANYSEKFYERSFSAAIGETPASPPGSDEDSSDYSSADDEGSDDSAAEVRERSHWGGSKKNQWKREQAEALFKLLEAEGYGSLPWDKLFGKIPKLKGIDEQEVKRMCWSLLLLALWECARDDAAGAKKREERKAEKKMEQAVGNPADTDGAATPFTQSEDYLQGLSFRKIWQANLSWVKVALSDAVAYARTNKPRAQNTLDHSKHENLIASLFYGSVWPALKGRGWKEEAASHGKHFTYDEHRLTSPREVLNQVPKIHPELNNMVIPVLSKIAASYQDGLEKDEEDRSKLVTLTAGNVDYKILNKLLQKYAPLQLLVDRKSSKKLSLSRRVLSACVCMMAARTIARRSTEDANGNDPKESLVKLLSIDPRLSPPHPLWTQKQDVVLVLAIAKHGWIDQDKCCRAITSDPEIKWGAPFDESERPEEKDGDEEVSGSLREAEFADLRSTAERASKFLNASENMLKAMKEFNPGLVVECYGLQQNSYDEDEPEEEVPSHAQWVVDDALLQQSFFGHHDAENSEEGHQEELPAKKDLAKRAKAVLVKSMNTLDDKASSRNNPASANTVSIEYGYQVIDQDDRCCVLLAEMVRALVKPSPPKAAKELRLLCSLAHTEAITLKDMFESSRDGVKGFETKSGSSAMQSIAKQLLDVKRCIFNSTTQAKNILRAMLSLDLVPPKSVSESLFPPKDVLDRPQNFREDHKKGSARSRDDGATFGEKAITKGLKKAVEANNGEPLLFSFDESPDADVQLTMIETLMLYSFCAEGIPVHLAESKNPGAVVKYGMSWHDAGQILQGAANDYHQTALDKVKKARSALKKFEGQDNSTSKLQASKKLELAERDESKRSSAIMHATDYCEHPEKLAKKSIMLLEKIRRCAGEFSTQTKNWYKFENGLGGKVPAWLGKELSKWAKEFDVADAAGKPLFYTTQELLEQNPTFRNTPVGSCLDKKACRQIICQISMLTRLRSILLENDDAKAGKIVLQAVKCLRKTDEFDKAPSWWRDYSDEGSSAGHNILLLQRLAEYGFLSILGSHGFGQGQVKLTDKSLKDQNLTKPLIQQRAYQLVRELHAQEDTARTLRLLEERRNRAAAKRQGYDRSLTECHTAKAPSRGGGIQTGLHAFFASTKDSEDKAPMGKRKNSSDSNDTDSPSDKKIRKNQGKQASKLKRKDSSAKSPSSSPEKKQKVGSQIDEESDIEIVGVKPASVE